MSKQIKAVLEHHGNMRVNNCIIIRRQGEKNDGAFYYVTVARNGNYLSKVLTLSSTATSCVAKMKADRNFWRGSANVQIQVWYDYPNARVRGKLSIL